jgi:sRNA-binding protein
MSLYKRREAAAACAGLVISALAEAFPRALSVCVRRRVPTALGIYRALLVAVQAAIIAGTVTAKDLKTALRRYIPSNGYLCACRQAGAARIDLAGNVVGTVTPAEANHAREFLTERRRKKPAARATVTHADMTPATPPSPTTKQKATARYRSRPWPKEFFCAMTNIPPPDIQRGRAGNEMSCASCGKRLYPKRGSRRMRFCGVACRQSALRARKWASRYRRAGPVTISSK